MSDSKQAMTRILDGLIGNRTTSSHIGRGTDQQGDDPMNIHTPDLNRAPSRDEAQAALALLRRWAGDSRFNTLASQISACRSGFARATTAI